VSTASALGLCLSHVFSGEQHLVLHIDNSGKENKNHTVIAYCQALVDGALFHTVVMKYMVPGHTQFLPDLILGNLRSFSKSQTFFSLKEVSDVMQGCGKDVDVVVLHPESQRDYKSWCSAWAVVQTNYNTQEAFLREQLRYAHFGHMQNGWMVWSTTSVVGGVLQRYAICRPRGREAELELVPWSQESVPEDKLISLANQSKFIPAGRLTMPGSLESLEHADAVKLLPLLLEGPAMAAGRAKRDNRRRALAGARGEIEHDWNRVVGATLLGDSTQYLVEWNGADWVDVLSCEAWGSAGDPSHTADELELEENICSDEISLQVERRWVNGTIVSFDTRSKMHFVVLANGVRMGVSLANAKPPWKLACITAQTWAAYMPHCE